MRKLILGLALASAVLALGATPASAQTQITIGGSTQSVTFTGEGAGSPTTVDVTLGTCSAGTCTLSGSAFGTGGLASGPAAYSITTADTNAITMTFLGGGLWSVAQTDVITFCYGGAAVCDGSLLTGSLTLLTFSQGAGSATGEFNSTATANLVVTGGSLAGVFTAAGGILTVTVNVVTGANVSTLLGTTGTLSGPILSGNLTPTPEPGSMVLLGSGLLALGTGLRRRIWRS